MLATITGRLIEEQDALARRFRQPPLSSIPAAYREEIVSFLQHGGKRIRPTLYTLAYLGLNRKPSPDVYTAAMSLELLHNFMLIHDDIIDHDGQRRDAPAMHVRLRDCLRKEGIRRFTGSDAAIIVGDMVYAMAIHSFLTIREDVHRKQRALEQLTSAAFYTGCGELDELFRGSMALSRMTRKDIYRIYDWKTAHYSFAAPMSMGATLAGGDTRTAHRLFQAGIFLGRAFQIRDDLLDLSPAAGARGRSVSSDLREGRPTLLLWFAYRRGSDRDKRAIASVFEEGSRKAGAAQQAIRVIKQSGAEDFARQEIAHFARKASALMRSTPVKGPYRDLLLAAPMKLFC